MASANMLKLPFSFSFSLIVLLLFTLKLITIYQTHISISFFVIVNNLDLTFNFCQIGVVVFPHGRHQPSQNPMKRGFNDNLDRFFNKYYFQGVCVCSI